MRVKEFVAFIKAREHARLTKEARGMVSAGEYAKRIARLDPIIAQYRFCNVRRNDDRVTKWIHQNWLDNSAWLGDYDEYLWFAMVVARLFNNEPALEAVQEFVLPFQPTLMKKVLDKRAAKGEKNFNAAYIVSTNGVSMDKVEYLITRVLKPMWKDREKTSKLIWVGQLANAHIALCNLFGLSSFMAAQVLADLKYAKLPHIWEDFHTFAASGPGSRRGQNRVMERPADAPWKEMEFRKILSELRDAANARLTGWEPITAQDIQNCLCEWDKYERVRLGEGRPKQLYKPRGI